MYKINWIDYFYFRDCMHFKGKTSLPRRQDILFNMSIVESKLYFPMNQEQI